MGSFSEEDRRRILGFYDPAIELWGPNDARALHWSAEEQQWRRFAALGEVGIFDGASILDVGCGFGDLYPYLRDRCRDISYLGLDINPHMIEAAQKKHPGVRFAIGDFGEWPEAPSRFDFVLASGTFSFKIKNYRQIYFSYIEKMWQLCHVGMAFNLLDARHHISDEIFAAYWPSDIYDFCTSITPNVKFNDRYLRQDFTMYLYR